MCWNFTTEFPIKVVIKINNEVRVPGKPLSRLSADLFQENHLTTFLFMVSFR